MTQATKEDIHRIENKIDMIINEFEFQKLKALDLVKFTDFCRAWGLDYKTALKNYERTTIKNFNTPLQIRISNFVLEDINQELFQVDENKKLYLLFGTFTKGG